MTIQRHFLLTVVLSLLLNVTSWAVPVEGIRVESTGGTVVDESSVRAYIAINVGDEFSRSAVAADVKSLQKSGRFAFVSVDVEPSDTGATIIFKVRQKPKIRSLRITGARHLRNKKVRELLDLGRGDRVDDATLAVQSQIVKEEYNKKYYPNTKISWSIEEDERTGQADVRVHVKEGQRTKVKRIIFYGNETISSRILKKIMQQKSSNIFSFLTGSGVYDASKLEIDIETLRSVYLDRGHLDAVVGQPVVTEIGRGKIQIEITIEEGRLYTIGDIKLDGVTLFPKDEVERVIRAKPGSTASLSLIRQSGQDVQDYYGSRGYLSSRVERKLDADLDRAIVDVDYELTEGSLAYIRQIKIKGNTRTKDKVIRRELAVYPGEIFDEVKVRRSESRLKNLGYFSFVNALPEPTADDDRYDVAFEVEEQKTGQFVIGAGFSSIDDIIGFAEISQGNFDIKGWPHFTGGGQKLKLRAQLGTERRDVELSFVEPWFLDRRLSLGVDLFQSDRKFLSDDYDQRNTGGRLSLGKSLGGYYRLNLIYSYELIDVFDVDENASALIKEEEGERSKSALGLQLIYDTRNNAFIPTRGLRTSLGATGAGSILGGDTDIYELEAKASLYVPLLFDHVLNIKGQTAVVDAYGDSDRVPIFDRQYLGGARTLRGFQFRDVGPKDENGEAIGGSTMAYATIEYTIPIVEKVRFAGFYDVGMVWADAYDFDSSNLNSDAGIGARFDIPGFPLRLDYAWPLETDETNERTTGRFNFLIGYVF